MSFFAQMKVQIDFLRYFGQLLCSIDNVIIVLRAKSGQKAGNCPYLANA